MSQATARAKEGCAGDVDSQSPPLTPPLKWAGGKRWLLPHIAPIWRAHQHRRYVEPFCGGLAIALGLQPERALLNDINLHLINFYRQVGRGLSLEMDARYNRKLFYAHRARFNQSIQDGCARSKEAAQLFYYLNRTCFNGLCRFNRNGEFNVPFGQYKRINYATDFLAYRDLFRRWKFTNKDLAKVSIEDEDFVYADPPYDVEFTTYSAGGFSWDDQVRTAELLASHGGPVLLSNQATKRIVELYCRLGFQLQFLEAPRRISRDGNRESAREVIASMNLP
jgi:DNA adenine methylase